MFLRINLLFGLSILLLAAFSEARSSGGSGSPSGPGRSPGSSSGECKKNSVSLHREVKYYMVGVVFQDEKERECSLKFLTSKCSHFMWAQTTVGGFWADPIFRAAADFLWPKTDFIL